MGMEQVENTGIKLDSVMELVPGQVYNIAGSAEVPFRAVQFSVVQGATEDVIIHQIRVGTSLVLGDAENQEVALPAKDFAKARSVGWGAIPAHTHVNVKVTNKGEKPVRFVAYVAGPVVK